MNNLIDKLDEKHSLELEEYELLLKSFNPDIGSYAAKKAVSQREKFYGNSVFIRGLIEISNICKNDCKYCGIRHSNKNCQRFRLAPNEILECCQKGYELGFRTFVLQGGEDPFFTDQVLISLISELKQSFPDCALTLSLGERSCGSYLALKRAGADRYLLRHETASKDHYQMLHPSSMSFDNRINCLKNLKGMGYQTGCGFMVGSPFQTYENLAKDLKFIEKFSPEMCGIGPFIPHPATPFAENPKGSVDLTCYLLSLIRLIKPQILLPATTALGTLDTFGREKGILSGANVVMPNLSPSNTRNKYEIYANKLNTGCESAEHLNKLKARMKEIGYEIVVSRGDAVA